jgi:hypothetical protein
VRTLLSIMPTLARDYDLHFKGFNNVPVTPPPNTSLYGAPQSQQTMAQRSNGSARSAARNRSSSSSRRESQGAAAKKNKSSATSSDGDQEQDQDEEDDHDEDDGDRQDSTAASGGGAEESGGEEGGGSEEDSKPMPMGSSTDEGEEGSPSGSGSGSVCCEDWRGSRCFEVLGIDVMVDSQLRPWLIEFNHLPRYLSFASSPPPPNPLSRPSHCSAIVPNLRHSFGTDSPLDQDIKERLMEEVFRVVNARPDDEQMYALYHKLEAERRLLADRNAAAALKLKEKLEREKKEEAERIGRERWSKRRAEAMREKEKQREAAEAAAAAKYDAVSVTRERERNLQMERLQKQQMMEDAPVSPERYKVQHLLPVPVPVLSPLLSLPPPSPPFCRKL